MINESKNDKKLIDLDNTEENEKRTGFTFIKSKVNNPNKELKYEEYNLILDELEKISSELVLLIDKSKDNKEILNDLLE